MESSDSPAELAGGGNGQLFKVVSHSELLCVDSTHADLCVDSTPRL